MTAPRPEFGRLKKGAVVATRDVTITRDTLVRYAGASGDFNPIHYNDSFAESVELPGVIAPAHSSATAAPMPIVSMPCASTPGRPTDAATSSR